MSDHTKSNPSLHNDKPKMFSLFRSRSRSSNSSLPNDKPKMFNLFGSSNRSSNSSLHSDRPKKFCLFGGSNRSSTTSLEDKPHRKSSLFRSSSRILYKSIVENLFSPREEYGTAINNETRSNTSKEQIEEERILEYDLSDCEEAVDNENATADIPPTEEVDIKIGNNKNDPHADNICGILPKQTEEYFRMIWSYFDTTQNEEETKNNIPSSKEETDVDLTCSKYSENANFDKTPENTDLRFGDISPTFIKQIEDAIANGNKEEEQDLEEMEAADCHEILIVLNDQKQIEVVESVQKEVAEYEEFTNVVYGKNKKIKCKDMKQNFEKSESKVEANRYNVLKCEELAAGRDININNIFSGDGAAAILKDETVIAEEKSTPSDAKKKNKKKKRKNRKKQILDKTNETEEDSFLNCEKDNKDASVNIKLKEETDKDDEGAAANVAPVEVAARIEGDDRFGLLSAQAILQALEFSKLSDICPNDLKLNISLRFSILNEFILEHPVHPFEISDKIVRTLTLLAETFDFTISDCHFFMGFIISIIAINYKLFLDIVMSQAYTVPQVHGEDFYNRIYLGILKFKNDIIQKNRFQDMNPVEKFALRCLKKIVVDYMTLVRQCVFYVTQVVHPNLFEIFFVNGAVSGDMTDFTEIANFMFMKLGKSDREHVIAHNLKNKRNNVLNLSLARHFESIDADVFRELQYFYGGSYLEENRESWQNFQQLYLNCQLVCENKKNHENDVESFVVEDLTGDYGYFYDPYCHSFCDGYNFEMLEDFQVNFLNSISKNEYL